MKNNVWRRVTAVGMAAGMLFASMPMASFAGEMITEENYVLIAEDDTEAVMAPELYDADEGDFEESFISEEGELDIGEELTLGIVSEETEEELELQAAEEDIVDEGTCGDNLTWSFDSNGTLTISGSGEMNDYGTEMNDIELPPWSSYLEQIEKIVLNEGITHIGDNAFDGCTQAICKLTIPNSVIDIGYHSFSRCEGLLGKLVIPGTVKKVGEGAFSFCEGLTSLTICEGVEVIGDGAFSTNNFTGNLIIPDSVTILGNGAFSGAGFTGSLSISHNLKEIPENCFYGCLFTGDIVIPDNVETICEQAFCDLKGSSLGKLTIPDSVKVIGDRAFSSYFLYQGFTEISLGDSITHIGAQAFYNNKRMEGELNLPDKLSYLGEGAFEDCRSLTGSVEIPEGVKNLKDRTFYNCSGLTGDIIIANGVKIIGDEVFYNCCMMTGDLYIPDSVLSIGENAFKECYKLSGDLHVSENAVSLGEGAFSNCASLHGSPFIPKGITEIPPYLYASCTKLTGELIIPEGIETIGDCAFNNCGELGPQLKLPESLKGIGNSAFYSCSGFRGELVLPDGIETIGPGAFSFCTGFSGRLAIPSGLSKIEFDAFSGCSGITGNLEIPDNITSIGMYAFNGCTGFDGTLKLSSNLSELDIGAFLACENVTGTVIIPNTLATVSQSSFANMKSIDNIIISDSVTKIDNGAFYGCTSLRNVVIPENVAEVGVGAFSGCTLLEKVVIKNSECALDVGSFGGDTTPFPNGCILCGYYNSTTFQFSKDYSFKFECISHSWDEEATVDQEPTCTKPGSNSIHCLVCDAIKEGSVEEIPANGHSWNEGVVTKAPTCTDTGIKTYTCTVCDATKTEEIPANGHSWNEEATVDKEPTCTEPGSRSIHCSVCDAIKEGTVEEILANGHSWDEGAVTKAPTCTDTGIKTYTCSVCEETITETIPANGHSWNEEATVDKEPTCTELGSKSIHCSVCNAVKEGSEEEIPTLGHAYDSAWEWSDNMESATLVLTCSRNSTHVVRLPGDVLSEITIDATYIQEGEKTYTASVEYNGQTYEDRQPRVIPTLNPYGTTDDGFAWEVKEGVLTVTLQDDAQSTGMPDYATADAVPWSKAAKELNVSKIVVEEGITKIGSNAFTGLNSVNEISLPRSLTELAEDSVDESALGNVKINFAGSKSEWDSLTQGTAFNDVEITSTHTHTWDSGKVTKAATVTAAGIKTFTCTDCGETKTEVIPIIEEKITISKKPSIKKPTAAKTSITVKWSHFKHTSKKMKPLWKKIKNVQIQCATDKGFTNIVKTATVGKSKTKAKIKGLQKNTTYYVRVRYYDGTGYSNWSGVKKIKTKK